MKKKCTQIMAFIALLGIISGIIGTGFSILLGNNNPQEQPQLTPEKIQEIINDIPNEKQKP